MNTSGIGASSLNRSCDKAPFAMNSMLFDTLQKEKNKMSSEKQIIQLSNQKSDNPYHPGQKKKKRKRSSASVSSNDVYRHKDSRHFSHQQKPMYIANLLSGSPAEKLHEEIRKTKDRIEDNKSPSPVKNSEMTSPKLVMQRSPSENHNDKNFGNLLSHAPHGGALERLNNEERLNFLSDAALSRIDNNSVHRRQEKSVDLDLRSGALLDRNSTDFITNKVINNNQLSKYLTKFIGNRDYRTTEERELAKCTFKPKFLNRTKFKRVKGKLAGYIKEDDSTSRTRDIALFSASENIKSVIQGSHSVGRGGSVDGRMNNSLCMSDGGFLLRTNDDETSTISVLNEMRSIPTIYANKNVSNLGGILQFGYSHKYHEKKHYKDIIKPTIKNINKTNTTFFGSSKALSLSIHEGESSSLFQAKVLTPMKSKNGLKSQRLFTNRLTSKAEQVKNSPKKTQEEEAEFTSYTPEQLAEIRKIHDLHFRLKR